MKYRIKELIKFDGSRLYFIEERVSFLWFFKYWRVISTGTMSGCSVPLTFSNFKDAKDTLEKIAKKEKNDEVIEVNYINI